MRERLFALGFLWVIAGSPSVRAHEDGTTPPSPEGTAGRATAQPATQVATQPLKASPPKVAPTVKPAATPRAGQAGPRPVRLTLDEKDRPVTSPTSPAGPRGESKAEPAPPGSRPSSPAALPGAESGEAVVVKKAAPLKLAPSAKEIESERQTVLKPPVENRPDRYENQRPDVPSPTQVRRVPGPGSSVGSTANERKATMIENSGPQQNTTYRRW